MMVGSVMMSFSAKLDTPGIEPGTARKLLMLSGRDNQLHHVPYNHNSL